jgi:hypothetical protein
MDLYIFNDDDWGPWVKAEDVSIKIGDVFILGIYGPTKDNPENLIYKALQEPSGDKRSTALSKYQRRDLVWEDFHSWHMVGNAAVRLLKNNSKAVSSTLNKECPCGIYRGDCEYHK